MLIGACERIKEVILFIPVIYNTVRWDYSSLFKILHHWISRMEEAHRNDDVHSNAPIHAEQLKQVRLLLERVVKCEYEDKFYDYHESKWGDLVAERSKTLEGYTTISFRRSKALTEDEIKQMQKELIQGIKHADYQEKQDIARAFLLIKKHYGKWWI